MVCLFFFLSSPHPPIIQSTYLQVQVPTYLLSKVVDYYQLESSSYQVYSPDVCFHTNHEKTCLNNFSQIGLIITFLQFLFVTFFAYPSQFSSSSSSSSGAESSLLLQRPKVPMRRWAFIAFMFFGINMLNNWAFAYNISVPVHIILRSFGSVTTMIAGFVRGKRYSLLQVLSVVLLTVGVLISAWADSQRKVLLHLQLRVVAREDVCSVMLTTLFSFFSQGKKMSYESHTSSSDYTEGLAILLLAQFLSAYMGAYTEDTYARFGASWTENLFYSHVLSLPFFLPLSGTLRNQYHRLANTPYLDVQRSGLHNFAQQNQGTSIGDLMGHILSYAARTPQGIFYLVINAFTQLICISGVNLLSSKSSAVTVTIVLNIRKLVSFILSTLIFGHTLNPLMIFGSTLVFGSGALYGWETSWRIPQQKARAQALVDGGGGGGNDEKKKLKKTKKTI